MNNEKIVHELNQLKKELAEMKSNRGFKAYMKKAFSKTSVLTGTVLTIIITSFIVYAAQITKPNTFDDGNIISAGEVNENFDKLYLESNDQDRRISQGVGTFCGASYDAYNGNLGGWTGAKGICETTCGNTNAHMCTAHETAISAQLGLFTGSGSYWYGSFVSVMNTSASNYVNQNCSGWTNGSDLMSIGGFGGYALGSRMVVDDSNFGVVEVVYPTSKLCSETAKVACCL